MSKKFKIGWIIHQYVSRFLHFPHLLTVVTLFVRHQFAEFWAHLGKDRRGLATNAEHISLLSSMSTYRAQARDRVKSAMDQLVQLSEDLAELRDRVVEPALVGVDAAIPIEVHLEGLRRGVQRLKGFRKEGEERRVFL